MAKNFKKPVILTYRLPLVGLLNLEFTINRIQSIKMILIQQRIIKQDLHHKHLNKLNIMLTLLFKEIYSKIQIKLSYQLITLINNNKKMETPMMAKKSLLKHRFQNCCLNE
jgi:hypothetical protein